MSEHDIATFMVKELSAEVKEYLGKKVFVPDVKNKEMLMDFYFKMSLYFPEVYVEFKNRAAKLKEEGIEILSVHNENYPGNII